MSLHDPNKETHSNLEVNFTSPQKSLTVTQTPRSNVILLADRNHLQVHPLSQQKLTPQSNQLPPQNDEVLKLGSIDRNEKEAISNYKQRQLKQQQQQYSFSKTQQLITRIREQSERALKSAQQSAKHSQKSQLNNSQIFQLDKQRTSKQLDLNISNLDSADKNEVIPKTQQQEQKVGSNLIQKHRLLFSDIQNHKLRNDQKQRQHLTAVQAKQNVQNQILSQTSQKQGSQAQSKVFQVQMLQKSNNRYSLLNSKTQESKPLNRQLMFSSGQQAHAAAQILQDDNGFQINEFEPYPQKNQTPLNQSQNLENQSILTNQDDTMVQLNNPNNKQPIHPTLNDFNQLQMKFMELLREKINLEERLMQSQSMLDNQQNFIREYQSRVKDAEFKISKMNSAMKKQRQSLINNKKQQPKQEQMIRDNNLNNLPETIYSHNQMFQEQSSSFQDLKDIIHEKDLIIQNLESQLQEYESQKYLLQLDQQIQCESQFIDCMNFQNTDQIQSKSNEQQQMQENEYNFALLEALREAGEYNSQLQQLIYEQNEQNQETQIKLVQSKLMQNQQKLLNQELNQRIEKMIKIQIKEQENIFWENFVFYAFMSLSFAFLYFKYLEIYV
eukprot:403359921